MQTFLPHVDFRDSLDSLDDKRLGKQRVEVFQILRALVWPDYGWKNHPAVLMWRGFVPALVRYGLDTCDAWVARGCADDLRRQLLDFTGGREPQWSELVEGGQLPPWLGDPRLHGSHRAALLRKQPQRYATWAGDVEPDAPYWWPGPTYPTWPWPSTVEHEWWPAADQARRASFGEGRLAAYEAAAGADCPIMWWCPGPALASDRGEPPWTARGGTAATGGTVSPSIARPPDDAALEAMGVEAALAPPVVWRRPDDGVHVDRTAAIVLADDDPACRRAAAAYAAEHGTRAEFVG